MRPEPLPPAPLPATPPMAVGERGFTLLEMLVALAVLGVVLATLFRFAGDSLVRHGGREAQLRLALAAEAAFQAERLEPGVTPAGARPADITLAVERRDFATAAPADLAAYAGMLDDRLDWLVVTATDRAGRRFTLEAPVPAVVPR